VTEIAKVTTISLENFIAFSFPVQYIQKPSWGGALGDYCLGGLPEIDRWADVLSFK